MHRNSLTHLARGVDGLCFFQWRASISGSEKFHSAMLPHAGTDSRIWREAVELGGILEKLAEVGGSTVNAETALVFSWEAWWAYDQEFHPSSDVVTSTRSTPPIKRCGTRESRSMSSPPTQISPTTSSSLSRYRGSHGGGDNGPGVPRGP